MTDIIEDGLKKKFKFLLTQIAPGSLLSECYDLRIECRTLNERNSLFMDEEESFHPLGLGKEAFWIAGCRLLDAGLERFWRIAFWMRAKLYLYRCGRKLPSFRVGEKKLSGFSMKNISLTFCLDTKSNKKVKTWIFVLKIIIFSKKIPGTRAEIQLVIFVLCLLPPLRQWEFLRGYYLKDAVGKKN